MTARETAETFEARVVDAFEITGRGWFVTFAPEQGVVHVGDHVRVQLEGRTCVAKVGAVEYVDRLGARESWPALGLPELRETPVVGARLVGVHACPVCESLTLTSPGTCELCPVCFWEDDAADETTRTGGPNGARSGQDARRNFAALGASDPAHRASVRPARPDERPR
ncbi:MAG: CPCC family cysteine-rich protein [Polyangiales bacterium]